MLYFEKNSKEQMVFKIIIRLIFDLNAANYKKYFFDSFCFPIYFFENFSIYFIHF